MVNEIDMIVFISFINVYLALSWLDSIFGLCFFWHDPRALVTSAICLGVHLFLQSVQILSEIESGTLEPTYYSSSEAEHQGEG